MMSKLIVERTAIAEDVLDAVNMKLALINQLAARIDRQKLARDVGKVFAFDDVVYVF